MVKVINFFLFLSTIITSCLSQTSKEVNQTVKDTFEMAPVREDKSCLPYQVQVLNIMEGIRLYYYPNKDSIDIIYDNQKMKDSIWIMPIYTIKKNSDNKLEGIDFQTSDSVKRCNSIEDISFYNDTVKYIHFYKCDQPYTLHSVDHYSQGYLGDNTAVTDVWYNVDSIFLNGQKPMHVSLLRKIFYANKQLQSIGYYTTFQNGVVRRINKFLYFDTTGLLKKTEFYYLYNQVDASVIVKKYNKNGKMILKQRKKMSFPDLDYVY